MIHSLNQFHKYILPTLFFIAISDWSGDRLHSYNTEGHGSSPRLSHINDWNNFETVASMLSEKVNSDVVVCVGEFFDKFTKNKSRKLRFFALSLKNLSCKWILPENYLRENVFIMQIGIFLYNFLIVYISIID